MERTKGVKKNEIPINVLAELASRMGLAGKLGFQFDGDRDLYQALGYPTGQLTFDDFFARYVRQDIAKAIIDRPVSATWQGPLELLETNNKENTTFEKAWTDLNRKFGIKTRLSRVDRLTGIGRYGVLLMGLGDVQSTEGFKNSVTGNKHTLEYLKPFGEKNVKVNTYELDPKNKRYGLPKLYEVEVADAEGSVTGEVIVHHSRVIHIVYDNLESEVFGTPVLEPVFNRLMDLDKVVGGDAEMFWKNARPGYQGKIDKDYTMTKTMEDDLINQVDEYEHGLRRMMVNSGVDWEALKQDVSDPVNHVAVILQMISSQTGIPVRILTGSERGELASSQDRGEWLSYAQTRREEHAEIRIVRPLVDRFIELGILPTPKDGYSVKWADLFAQSESARVEIGKARANAIREYFSYGPVVLQALPLDAFFEFCWGLTSDQIELVTEMRNNRDNEEIIELITPEEEAIIEKPAKKKEVVKKDTKPKAK